MSENTTASNKNSLFLFGAVLAVVAIVWGVMQYNPGARITKADTLIDDDPILGNIDAPVTIVEFTDYECPFCKKLHDTVSLKLRDEFVATGKVKVVVRDYPLDFHEAAIPAAIAAACANEQGAFWQYHDSLFENQDKLENFDYVGLAEKFKLETAVFKSCLESKESLSEIEKDRADGVNAGVTGTPGIFVGDTFINGAYPYEAFEAAIERELQRKGL